MKTPWLFLSVCFFGLVPLVAKADGVDGNFVVCDSCVNESDFASAAQVWYGTRNVQMLVTVGNPDTGVLYSMSVRPGGTVPLAVPPINNPDVILHNSRENVVSAAQLAYASQGTGQPVIGLQREDTQDEPAFAATVIAYKNSVLFDVGSGQEDHYGDVVNSYSDAIASMEVTGKMIWAEELAVNPGFAEIDVTSLSGLKDALDAYFGHGILVTVIFKNGDVATFQINVLDSDAVRVVNGTAKDRFGNSLPDSDTGINGGGEGGANVSNSGGADITGYSLEGDDEWLVCTYVGGVLQGCIIETDQE